MSDVLATAGLTKRYGGLMANDGVAIALAAGEIRGLIGPNGAGKTTFVNLVTGIERPDEGEILLDGSAITGLGRIASLRAASYARSRWRACSAISRCAKI